MKLTLGFSPCPNDTFIFDALVHQKIDTQGLEFEVEVADVEELNRRSLTADLDVTKLSYSAYANATDQYVMLNSGSALGRSCGPLLIAREPDLEVDPSMAIAIPGKLTTANFLLSLAYPMATNRREVLFSEIENKVLSGEVDAGLIIHENRFTYRQKGLNKLIDLGEYWEQMTGMPIPLGGIAVRRELSDGIKQQLNSLIKRSVEFAIANPEESKAYVASHAQEMDEEVIRQHIRLYVNDFSVDLGKEGKEAISKLFEMASQMGVIDSPQQELFLS